MVLPMGNFVFLLNYENTKENVSCLSKTDVISVQYKLCKVIDKTASDIHHIM